MGVYKLWELLLTIAQPFSIDQLSGKILAIDASIWIVKIDSLYSSNSQKLKSILSKIMLFKRNNILPIFVFDGVAPILKRKTLEQRYQKRLVAGQLQAKKKSEIQIMRMVQGSNSNSRLSQKSAKIKKHEQELSQVNKTLKNLSQFQQKANESITSQLLQKITLQSQILNTKYKIMLDLTPTLKNYQYFIEYDQYETLDLQRKIQFLDELQEYKWKHVKRERTFHNRANLNQQQKLRRDLEVIEKRSIIREMQDNLFRKMMQKNIKIENGFQIIETIYNGRKLIQKRKVKQEGSNQFGIGMRKGKMKNDANCFNFKEGVASSDDGEEGRDEFLKQFCTVNVEDRDVSLPQLEPKVLQEKNTKQVKKSNKQRKRQEQHQDSSENIIPFQNYREKKSEYEQPEQFVNKDQLHSKYNADQQGDQPTNRDNLPRFSSNQHLYTNYSNDNLELQNLLTILGIPYVIAPSEAQAQCAALEQLGIVDGIITQDSDVFLFGGKNVFRGVFQNNIRFYNSGNILEKLRLNRQKLIIFALLLGSDYTGGVKGVGLVNAMQIIKVFNTFDKLQSFKKWARLPDILLPQEEKTSQLLKQANKEQAEFYELHRKFKNYWYVDQEFGNHKVKDAYLSPEVIREQQIKSMKKQGKFQSKPCNLPILQNLLKEKLDLQQKQYEHFIKLLTLEFKGRPNTLYNYFNKGEANQFAKIRSKRLQRSLGEGNSD